MSVICTCLYCGAKSSIRSELSICRCGRRGHWNRLYKPQLIEDGPFFDSPDWLRKLRYIRYSLFPVNKLIVAKAIAEVKYDLWFGVSQDI